MILNNHSLIVDYQIDTNKFPLAKKCKFIKAVIKENQYLYIPKKWFHLVITEPDTVALSFEIMNIDGNTNNFFYKYYKNKIPFKRNGNKFKFDYENFIKKSMDRKFRVIHSNSYEVAPVIKNEYQKKYYTVQILSDIIKGKNNDEYLHIISNELDDINNYREITDFINFDQEIINKYSNNLFEYNFDDKFKEYDKDVKINFIKSIWMSFDKPINSGLHYDDYDNFLYVLHGKKTVYLSSPENYDNLYIKSLNKAETI